MSFRDFIKKQLQIAKINAEHQDLFTDPEGMNVFIRAVTHPTFDANNNYQELEFVGDGIIKGILSQYIPRRFPEMASGGSQYSKKGTGEGVLSKTRRFLEQRKTLSDFALKLGFWNYVLADEETKGKLRKETLEDVFEAFVGALVEVVDQRVKRGLGYYYAYNYVEASLDNLEIDISQETLDDPITRLNELYKANIIAGDKPPLKWGDAAYRNEELLIPRFNSHPPNPRPGDIYFHKIPFIYGDNQWRSSIRPGLIIQPYPFEPVYDREDIEKKRPTNAQMLWKSSVYGFPGKLGREPDPLLRGVRPGMITDNPQKYGAAVIGKGLAFKLKDAKKSAAKQALDFLVERGYKKA